MVVKNSHISLAVAKKKSQAIVQPEWVKVAVQRYIRQCTRIVNLGYMAAAAAAAVAAAAIIALVVYFGQKLVKWSLTVHERWVDSWEQ